MRRWFAGWCSIFALFVVVWSGRAEAQERCPFAANGVIDNTDATQTGRFQNGPPSTCGFQKTVPSLLQNKSTFHFDAYTLRNRTGASACVTITATPSAGSVHSAAYLGSFDPANPQTNYLGDSGGNSNGAPLSYAVNVPALGDVVVVVNETGNQGATYSLSVTDCGAVVVTSITPNAGPTAGGTAVTIKGSGFLPNPTVTLGGAASNVVVVDEGTITATTPAVAASTVDLTVDNTDMTSATLPQAYTYVPPSDTTIAIASSINPTVYGQSAVFTVTATSPAGTPTGNIAFMEGAATLATVALDGGGHATMTRTNLNVGAHKIRAVYAGNVTFAAGASPELTQNVSVAPTTTALTSSVEPSTFGDAVIFTATVLATAPASGIPTGSVIYTDNGLLIGVSNLDTLGKATFTTAGLSAGVPHAVIATYAGSVSYQTSASPPLAQTVDFAPDAGTDSGTSSSGGADSGTSSSSSSSGGADAGTKATNNFETGGGGCDCRTAGGGSNGLAAMALGLFALAIMTRRKRG
jgi:MYXO-CTERM domain-containing protein